MSFGGSVQAMITTIKNNEKLRRNKRKRLKNQLGGYNSNENTEYNLPKATPKQLEDIRLRLKKERKLWWIKIITLTLTGIISLVIGLIWLSS